MVFLGPPRIWLRIPLIFLIVGTILLVVIMLILAFTHAFAQLEPIKRCFPAGFAGIGHAKWPNWIGCTIAAHETLAAGLIGSAGALLAAAIAADAVWQQVKDTRQKLQLAEQRRAALRANDHETSESEEFSLGA